MTCPATDSSSTLLILKLTCEIHRPIEEHYVFETLPQSATGSATLNLILSDSVFLGNISIYLVWSKQFAPQNPLFWDKEG